MQGISAMKREGDAEMQYEAMTLNLRIPLRVDTISVNYDYLAKIMNIGPTGGMEARVSKLNIFVEIVLDTKTLEVVLQDFKITDAGSINVRFSGHPLLDWLMNALTKVITLITHDIIKNVVEGQVKGLLEDVIAKINNMRPS